MNIPGYTIKKLLGKGGMASVFLAVDEKFERMVAIKIMSPQLSAEKNFRERFLREAKIVARISHPNIVAVYDVSNVGNYYYIAMEYHPGGDLKRRIQKGLTVAESLNVTVSVARALDYAHSKGYLHRDIKPDNILFRADGSAVLTDFGIAKAVDASTNTGIGLTQVGLVAGTPTYMSPEQARGRPLDGVADLYSLGIVFYEMLTGKPPYQADEPIALAVMHLNEPIPKLEGKLKHFQPLLNGLMAKDPQQRLKRGNDVVEKIEALAASYDFRGDVAAGKPVSDGRKGFHTSLETLSAASLERAARKRRRLQLMGGGVALAAIAGAGIYFGPQFMASSAPKPLPQPVVAKVVAAPPAASAAVASPYQAELDAAAAALERGDLVAPLGKNAADDYRDVLNKDPQNPTALAGLTQISNALQLKVYTALQKHDVAAAQTSLEALKQFAPNTQSLPDLTKAVASVREGRATPLNLPPPPPVAMPAKSNPDVVVSEAPVIMTNDKSGSSSAPMQPQVVAAPQAPQESADDVRDRIRIAGLMHKASDAMQAGNYTQALAEYREVLDIDPDNQEARDGLRKAVASTR